MKKIFCCLLFVMFIFLICRSASALTWWGYEFNDTTLKLLDECNQLKKRENYGASSFDLNGKCETLLQSFNNEKVTREDLLHLLKNPDRQYQIPMPSKDYIDRHIVLEIFGRSKWKAALPDIRGYVTSKCQWPEKKAAIWALANIGPSENDLVKIAEHSEFFNSTEAFQRVMPPAGGGAPPSDYYNAALLLIGPKLIPYIVRAAEDAVDPELQKSRAEAIIIFRQENAIPFLIDAAKSGNPFVRSNAYKSLSVFKKNKSVGEFLYKAIFQEKNQIVFLSILDALQRLDGKIAESAFAATLNDCAFSVEGLNLKDISEHVLVEAVKSMNSHCRVDFLKSIVDDFNGMRLTEMKRYQSLRTYEFGIYRHPVLKEAMDKLVYFGEEQYLLSLISSDRIAIRQIWLDDFKDLGLSSDSMSFIEKKSREGAELDKLLALELIYLRTKDDEVPKKIFRLILEGSFECRVEGYYFLIENTRLKNVLSVVGGIITYSIPVLFFLFFLRLGIRFPKVGFGGVVIIILMIVLAPLTIYLVILPFAYYVDAFLFPMIAVTLSLYLFFMSTFIKSSRWKICLIIIAVLMLIGIFPLYTFQSMITYDGTLPGIC